MGRAPEWTISEFTIVAENPRLPDEEVAAQLPGRTRDAVGFVRAGLHDYHRGRENNFISQLIKDRLRIAGAQYECPKCDARLG